MLMFLHIKKIIQKKKKYFMHVTSEIKKKKVYQNILKVSKSVIYTKVLEVHISHHISQPRDLNLDKYDLDIL